MGLLSWLFPTPADRIAKAQDLMAREQYNDARLEVIDLEEPAAKEIVEAAVGHLAQMNLDAAVSWAHAGDEHRVEIHLDLAEQFQTELAEQFGRNDLDKAFRAARQEIRELHASRAEEEKRKQEEKDARLLSVDPFGFSGGPSLLKPPISDDMTAEDAVELTARLDLLIANYPDELQPRLAEVGGDFAKAVLDLDDGRADLALQGLLALPEDNPLVCWETARAAYALGDPAAAARTLRRFPNLAGGHCEIGRNHSAVFLAQMLAESGDLAEALQVLRALGPASLKTGGFLFAQLLFTTGELAKAEQMVRALLKESLKALPLYSLMAQIRLAGGHRVEAMTALEGAMGQTCGTPGGCGYMPPDPQIVRLLATLYLEDGIETERALELWTTLQGMQRKPSVDERYLGALIARAEQDPEASDLAKDLWSQSKASSPMRARLEKYLPV